MIDGNLQQLRRVVKGVAVLLLAAALALYGIPLHAPNAAYADSGKMAAGSAELAADAISDDGDSGGGLSNGGSEELSGDDAQTQTDHDAATAVNEMIDALPEADKATADDEETYAKAKRAYDDLTDVQREYVGEERRTKLQSVGKAVAFAVKARAKEIADQKAAKAATALIAALPAAGKVTADYYDAALAAQAVFDSLTADQKKLVSAANQAKLAAVVSAAKQVKAAQDEAAAQREAQVKADKVAARSVSQLIAKLPSASKVTADDQQAAANASAAYEALTTSQKAYVSQASKDKLAAVLQAVKAAVKQRDADQQESSQPGQPGNEEDVQGGTGDVGGDASGTGDDQAGGDAGGTGGDQAGGQTDGDTTTPAGDPGQQPANPAEGGSSSTGTSGTNDQSGSQSGSNPESGKPTNVRTGTDLDPNAVYRIDLYATATNADNNWLKPVLDDEEDASGLHWLKSGIKDKGGRLRLLVRAAWGDGRAFWQYDEDWRTLDLRYSSSDTSVATVSSAGVVTATGDGEAVLSVTEQSSGLVAKLGVRVAGQKGAYVEEVYLCDATGHQYEDERITFQDTANKLNLYVRQALSDGTTVSNAPEAADYAPDRLTPTSWSVSDSDIGSVNAETGVFIPKALGSVKVYATSTGGDPDVAAGKVRGFVWVVIDDGDYNTTGDIPSDELTVNVIYDAYDQRDEDGSYRYIVKSQHYTLSELQALESEQCTYTLTRSDGGYVTASAQGIHLLTLIELTGVEISQVKSFTFTALDGVNPGKMTYSFLFGERYYWPNYEFGGNLSGAVNVFPMLAWASDWRDSKNGAEDSSANYDGLPDGTRLRLLFGSSTTADNKTDHSLKYISEMTIRIKGAPNITDGTSEDGSGKDDEGGGAVVPGTTDNGNGSGDDPATQPGDDPTTQPGDDPATQPGENPQKTPPEGQSPVAGTPSSESQGTDSKPGDENDSKGNDSKNGQTPTAPGVTARSQAGDAPRQNSTNPQSASPSGTNPQPANNNTGDNPSIPREASKAPTPDARTDRASDAGEQAAESAQAQTEQEVSSVQDMLQQLLENGASAEGAAQQASQRWHAYQMLNPEDSSNLQIEDLKENPLQLWAIVLIVGMLLAGAAGSAITFRRQLAASNPMG